MPVICGSTTPCTSPQATAASTALPPARSASTPASTASGCGATTIPCFGVIDASSPSPRSGQQSPGRLHDRAREALHALQALRHVLAPEVEDELADPEIGVLPDVAGDLLGRSREGPPLAARR